MPLTPHATSRSAFRQNADPNVAAMLNPNQLTSSWHTAQDLSTMLELGDLVEFSRVLRRAAPYIVNTSLCVQYVLTLRYLALGRVHRLRRWRAVPCASLYGNKRPRARHEERVGHQDRQRLHRTGKLRRAGLLTYMTCLGPQRPIFRCRRGMSLSVSVYRSTTLATVLYRINNSLDTRERPFPPSIIVERAIHKVIHLNDALPKSHLARGGRLQRSVQQLVSQLPADFFSTVLVNILRSGAGMARKKASRSVTLFDETPHGYTCSGFRQPTSRRR